MALNGRTAHAVLFFGRVATCRSSTVEESSNRIYKNVGAHKHSHGQESEHKSRHQSRRDSTVYREVLTVNNFKYI